MIPWQSVDTLGTKIMVPFNFTKIIDMLDKIVVNKKGGGGRLTIHEVIAKAASLQNSYFLQ